MKNAIASIMFFTRLPLWRLKALHVPAECFKNVVSYWAVAGWLTGGVMAAVFFAASKIFPADIAMIFAMLARVVFTGALHEDGLADFADGFGGGTDRAKILSIMKDSHIGAFGVIAQIFYFILFYKLACALPPQMICAALFAADPFCKFIASFVCVMLPYARPLSQSKAGHAYCAPTAKSLVINACFGILPFAVFIAPEYWLAAILPAAVFVWGVWLMGKKIGGYTGDCCGALFLMCELSLYGGLVLISEVL